MRQVELEARLSCRWGPALLQALCLPLTGGSQKGSGAWDPFLTPFSLAVVPASSPEPWSCRCGFSPSLFTSGSGRASVSSGLPVGGTPRYRAMAFSPLCMATALSSYPHPQAWG